MQVKKQQLEPDMEQQTSSKLGKEDFKVVYCHTAYLAYMQSTSCKMPGWMNHKLESRLPGEISTASDMQMCVCVGLVAQSCRPVQPGSSVHGDSPGKNPGVGCHALLKGRKWRGTKELLDEGERGEWESALKLSIPKAKIVASGPITSWKIDGEKVETVADFISLGSKIIADDNCSHEIKRPLILRRKAMTNLDSILKNRHHFADKGPYSQSYNFSSSHV